MMEDNHYFIDVEHQAEMARLLVQESLLNAHMGGLPERGNDFSAIHKVLDIGCGPAGWLLDIAATQPSVSVVGIDISQMMITYAQAQAQAHGLSNTSFALMDATQPLSFADGSFDLVNGRHLISFLRGDQWPDLLRECYRITRPSGIIRLVGTELSGITNSPAFHRAVNLFIEALQKAGRGLTPLSPTIGVMAQLAQLVSEAGYENVQLYPYLIDFSAGTNGHQATYEDWSVGYKLVMPFLSKRTGTPLAELEQHYQDMLVDLALPTFRGYTDLYSIVARKS